MNRKIIMMACSVKKLPYNSAGMISQPDEAGYIFWSFITNPRQTAIKKKENMAKAYKMPMRLWSVDINQLMKPLVHRGLVWLFK